MFYYAFTASGKPAGSSDIELNNPDLIAVPTPAVNQYQIWDGQQWTGSEKDLLERYRDFRLGIIQTSGWQKIRQSGAVTMFSEFMVAVSYMEDNPGMVKQLWNAIVTSFPDGSFTNNDIQEWQEVVSVTGVGIQWIGSRDLAFDFTLSGLMI